MRFDPDEWGTVADWIAAIGSAGALGAAVLLIRNEARVRRAEEADKQWSQARLVSITASAARGGYSKRDEYGNMVDAPPFSYEATARITNSSSMPLHNLKARLYVSTVLVQEHSRAVLLPNSQSEVKGRLRNVAEPDLTASAVVTFTDAMGLDWTLTTSKPLRRATSSSG